MITNNVIQILSKIAMLFVMVGMLVSCEKEQVLLENVVDTEVSSELEVPSDESQEQRCYVRINSGIYQYIPTRSAVNSSFGICNNHNGSGSVLTNKSWIKLKTTTYSTGNSVHYSVTRNYGPQRSGYIYVGCTRVTVEQRGYNGTPNPPSYNPTCYN